MLSVAPDASAPEANWNYLLWEATIIFWGATISSTPCVGTETTPCVGMRRKSLLDPCTSSHRAAHPKHVRTVATSPGPYTHHGELKYETIHTDVFTTRRCKAPKMSPSKDLKPERWNVIHKFISKFILWGPYTEGRRVVLLDTVTLMNRRVCRFRFFCT